METKKLAKKFSPFHERAQEDCFEQKNRIQMSRNTVHLMYIFHDAFIPSLLLLNLSAPTQKDITKNTGYFVVLQSS